MVLIPVGLGHGPTEYALSRGKHLIGLLFLQAICMVLRFVLLWSTFRGFFEAMSIALGWYAWRMNMDIAVVCVWGVLNLVQFGMDVSGGLVMLMISCMQLKFSQALLIAALPLADWVAAAFAWDLFKDHERHGGTLEPVMNFMYGPLDGAEKGEGKPLMQGGNAM